MTEGKWEKAKHDDIREGDVVRVTSKDGPKTTITEGKVTKYEEHGEGTNKPMWTIENFENFYGYEFRPNSDGAFATLEKFDPPFVWPTKLGAIVTGTDEDVTIIAVLVELSNTLHPEEVSWYTEQWGPVNTSDLDGLSDLTVVSEGVTVEA